MLFSKKNKLLLKLYYYQEMLQQPVVKGSTLEEILRLNYKQLHVIAKGWEERGYVVSRSERGGMMEYQLTTLGIMAVKRIAVRERRVKMVLLFILFMLAIYFFT